MSTSRSLRPEVRNPLLALPAAQAILALPAPQRGELAKLYMDLARDAGERAQLSWRKHKAPMAVYWKAVAVYAKHTARVLLHG